MTYKTRFQYLLDKARDIAQPARALNPSLDLPPLFFFTDPARTPHPEDIAIHMPEGCGIVYRHFGENHALQRARLLKKIAGDNGLTLLIGEDADLALEVGADGVHLREASLARAAILHEQSPALRLTLACHDGEILRHVTRDGGIQAVFISPVFASRSPSAAGIIPLGAKGASELSDIAGIPVYGLGGIGCDNILALRDSGLSGIGAIDAFRL